MKKRKKQLIFVVVLLCICGVAYFLANKYIDNTNAVTQSLFDDVLEVDMTTINKLDVTYSKYETHLVKENDEWKIAGKDEKPNASLVEEALKYAANIHARKTISDHGQLSEYGLDKPQITVSFETTTGEKYIIYIGNSYSMDESFFLKLENDDNVYTVAQEYASAFWINEDLLLKND